MHHARRDLVDHTLTQRGHGRSPFGFKTPGPLSSHRPDTVAQRSRNAFDAGFLWHIPSHAPVIRYFLRRSTSSSFTARLPDGGPVRTTASLLDLWQKDVGTRLNAMMS